MTNPKPLTDTEHYKVMLTAQRAALLIMVNSIEEYLGEPRTSDIRKYAYEKGYASGRKE